MIEISNERLCQEGKEINDNIYLKKVAGLRQFRLEVEAGEDYEEEEPPFAELNPP